MRATTNAPHAPLARELGSLANVSGPNGIYIGWRPADAADERRHRLLAEVTVGLERTKAMLARLGPDLAQSGLLAAFETRAPATYLHACRVAEGAVALASRIGLPAMEVSGIGRAALFHDIGKLAIPLHILDRPGSLSDDEMAILRLHVTIGAELLAGIPVLAATAPIVRATHERHDGSGYPFGLAGSTIPVGARIIALIDAHDAMTARRPYGTPLSWSDATAELVRCAGTHFDPDVVQAWSTMFGGESMPAVAAVAAGA